MAKSNWHTCRENHDKLMERARRGEAQNMDPELEYEIKQGHEGEQKDKRKDGNDVHKE